ncbi:hypothetical protein DIPPA_25772 [Diplonema papillatum]|nr:hypothetical protein DIPPA_25772 [Diplonema papillatum]
MSAKLTAGEEEELAKRFLSFTTEDHAESISEELKKFQLENRKHFKGMNASGTAEHRHEWNDIYKEYLAILERIGESFCKEHDLEDQDFVNVIQSIERFKPEAWQPFQSLLKKTDYAVFAKCLADDVCLCCGGAFPEGEEESK